MAHIMALTAFTKMHGLGNDFVIFDRREHDLSLTGPIARAVADRHTGIGCDQVVVLGSSDVADMSMRIFNSDGGEVEACGNASRCVVAREDRDCSIETAGGIISGRIADSGIAVDMGSPRFQWDEIPLAYAVDTQSLPIGWGPLSEGVCINVGNPHVVFFADAPGAVDPAHWGPLIENDPLFPERVNVSFAHVSSDGGIDLVVWERGAGLTLACGTGACATAVAAIGRKLVTSPVEIHLPGGTLTIAWERGGNILMTGPATHSFSGSIDLEALTTAR